MASVNLPLTAFMYNRRVFNYNIIPLVISVDLHTQTNKHITTLMLHLCYFANPETGIYNRL